MHSLHMVTRCVKGSQCIGIIEGLERLIIVLDSGSRIGTFVEIPSQCWSAGKISPGKRNNTSACFVVVGVVCRCRYFFYLAVGAAAAVLCVTCAKLHCEFVKFGIIIILEKVLLFVMLYRMSP